MALSGKRCKVLSVNAIVLIVFSAVHTSVVGFRTKSQLLASIKPQPATVTEKLETTGSLIQPLASIEMEPPSNVTTQPPLNTLTEPPSSRVMQSSSDSPVTEGQTEAQTQQTMKPEAQLPTRPERPIAIGWHGWKNHPVTYRVRCSDGRIYLDGKCQGNQVTSTTSSTTPEICPDGQPPQFDGHCHELLEHIVRSPCPAGTQADQYGKCRQCL